MESELHQIPQVKKYLEKLGYPTASIAFEYRTKTGKYIDVVVKKDEGVFIALELKDPDFLKIDAITDIEYHPLTRQIQRGAQEVKSEYFVLTNGNDYLWMKTGIGGRPERVDEVHYANFHVKKNTEKQYVDLILDHIYEFLRNFPITGNNLHDLSLVLFVKLKTEIEIDYNLDISEADFFGPKLLLESINRNYSPKQILEQALERLQSISLLKNKLAVLEFIDKLFLKSTRELYIPRWLGDFIIKKLKPSANDYIIDLFSRNGSISSSIYLNGIQNVRSYYFDQNDYYWIKIQQLLFLERELNIVFEPSLAVDQISIAGGEEAAAVIIAAPFNVRNAFSSESNLFEIGIKDSTSILINSALNSVKEGGQVTVIVADSFLSSSNLFKARKFLLNQSYIESIISLPPDCFKPYSSVKTSIVTFVKKRNPTKHSTFFAAVEERPKEYIVDSNYSPILKEILSNYEKFKSNQLKTKSKLGFAEDVIDIQNLHYSKYLFANKISETTKSSKYLYIPLIELIQHIFKGSSLVADYNNGDIPYIAPASVRKMAIDKSNFTYTSTKKLDDNNKRVETNDIIINSIGPNRGSAAIVSQDLNGILLNRHIIGLKAKTDIVNPEYLAIAFNSKVVQEQFLDRTSGSVIPTLNLKDLEELIIPVPDKDSQQRVVDEFNAILKERDATILKLADIQSRILIKFNQLGKEEVGI